jgi:PKD repeat protein
MLRKSIAISSVLFLAFFGLCMVANADLKDGLVAYYPFNGNANDESGNANNGTVNGATLKPDRLGNANSAYSFDGVNDYINIGNSNDFTFYQGLTFATWIKIPTSLDRDMYILNKWVDHWEDKSFAVGQNKKVGFYLWDIFSREVLLSTKYIESNTWTHVVATYDGSTAKLYIDGKYDSEKSVIGDVWNSTGNMFIGHNADRWDTYAPFSGSIDDIRIYNRALSASEIEQLYNRAPVIKSFTANPTSGVPSLTVNFECIAKDRDGTIAEYRWDFGDGEDNTTTKGTTSHSYASVGTFNAKVTVVDNDGAETTSKVIPVKVYYGADLTGKIEQFTFDEVNHKVKMTLRVTNGGDSLATPFDVSYHLSDDGTTPLTPAFKVIRANNGLKAGKSIAPLVDVKFDDSIYGKYILIYVDSGKEVTEIDETNNGTRLVIQPMVTQ